MNWLALLMALITLESGGNPNAVGDKHLQYPAYGWYQVRQPYLQDVTKTYKAEMISKFGHVLTLAEMKDKAKSGWVVSKYLKKYGEAYERKTGKKATPEILARIHNGGPDGYAEPQTRQYARNFIVEYKKHAKGK